MPNQDPTLPVKRMWWTDFIVNHPCVVILATLTFALALSVIPFVAYPFQLNDVGNFSPRDTEQQEQLDAYQQLASTGDPDPDQVIPERSQPQFGIDMYYVGYPDADGKETNVLNQRALEAILDFELTLETLDGYQDYCWLQYDNGTAVGCFPPTSLRKLPPPLKGFHYLANGKLNTTVNSVADSLAELAAIVDTDPRLGFFFDRDFSSSHLESIVTRSSYIFGGPFAGYNNMATPEARVDQYFEFRDWTANWFDTYQDKVAQYEKDEVMEVLVLGSGITDIEITAIVAADLSLFFGSVIIVAILIAVQTWSPTLAFFSMVHILLAFPISYFVYRMILGFEFFTQFNLLSLFVVLAIGADDVFVYTDAFKQSFLEGPNVNESLHSRVAWTFRRAAKAMFVTSFTTFAAFMATANSPIPTIRVLGLFTAFSVLINFTLIITWYPAVVVQWYRWGCHTHCCFRSANQLEKGAAKPSNDVATPPSPPRRTLSRQNSITLANLDEYRAVERFFHKTWTPAVIRYSTWMIIGSVVVVIVFAGFATQIQPVQTTFSFFPETFFVERAGSYASETFRQTEEGFKRRAAFVWGVEGMDRTGVDINNQIEQGAVKFDASFDLSSISAQLSIRETCEQIADFTDFTFQRQVQCPIQQFELWLVNATGAPSFPVATDFNMWFKTWLEDTTPPWGGNVNLQLYPERNMQSSVAFTKDGSRVQYMFIRANMTTNLIPDVGVARKHHKHWTDFIDDRNNAADTPEGVNKAYHTSSIYYTLYTSDVLVSSAIFGIAVSLSLALCVLLLATHNWRVSLMAIATITSVVVCMVGLIVVYGWELSLSETVSLVVLVGLSVDYVVHYAVAYVECTLVGATPLETRHLSLQAALTELGVSVVGGAGTSISTTLFLFPTTLLLLKRFGILIASSTLMSFLFANILFPALLAKAGPVGLEGDLKALFFKPTDQQRAGKPDPADDAA